MGRISYPSYVLLSLINTNFVSNQKKKKKKRCRRYALKVKAWDEGC